jgi:hypothetical protein
MLACGGEASTSTSAGGSATEQNGTGGAASGDSKALCADFANEQGLSRYVRIVNKTSHPIFLGPSTPNAYGLGLLFSIKQDGRLLPRPSGECVASCQLLRDQGHWSCPDIAPLSSAIELAPGEEHIATWNGLVLAQRTLPAECVGGESAEAESSPPSDMACRQLVQITPGAYTFSVNAGTELVCNDWLSPEECGSCGPSGRGGCLYSGHYVGGERLYAETQVDLGPARGVDASGEPRANEPVEIIFRD